MNITYQEVKPSAALQPYVDCYWLQSFGGTAGDISPTQSCLPFGMVEVIVQLDDYACDVCVNGKWVPLPKIFLAGIYQQAVSWRATGNARKFGMRLKPETFHLLFNTPPAVVYSNFTLLQNIAGREADYLVEKLSAVSGMSAIVAQAETFLLMQLRRHREQHDYTIEAARLIRSAKGNLSMDDVCKTVYVSPRQLQRSFREKFGAGPKMYMRIIRFRNAYVQMQHLDQHGGWTGLSYDLGYADQAHFIREFKTFSGNIPSLGKHNNEQAYGKYAMA